MEHLKLLQRSSLWAIRPEAVILAVIQLSAQRLSGSWECAKPSTIGKGASKIGVVPIEGVLTKDGPSWYGSNYDNIGNAVESFGADPEVKRIVLSVDSPGGEVTGLPETAALVASVAKQKPVSAIVTGMSASAAYWLTSQANDITLTPSGEVGSVGVRMMHVDVSRMLEDYGYKITELYSGDFKTEWSPFKPLTEAAQEDMQGRLDATHQDFIQAVQEGRGNRASQEMVDNRFGEGRMLSGDAALSHGLVDRLQAPRDFFRAITPPVEQELSAPAFPIRRTQATLEVMRRRVNTKF